MSWASAKGDCKSGYCTGTWEAVVGIPSCCAVPFPPCAQRWSCLGFFGCTVAHFTLSLSNSMSRDCRWGQPAPPGAPCQRGWRISAGGSGSSPRTSSWGQAAMAVIGFQETKAQTPLSRGVWGSWPQERLPFADKWTLLEVLSHTLTQVIEEGPSTCLLTGTQVYCDPASSYHLLWFVRFGGLIWGFPELQHHTGILAAPLLPSYTRRSLCMWNMGWLSLFSTSAFFKPCLIHCLLLPAASRHVPVLPSNPWTLRAGTQGSAKGLFVGRSSKHKYSSASPAHQPTAVGVYL